MAFFTYVTLEGEALPLPDSYELQMVDVEADSSGETEAGTIQRDVVRYGRKEIALSFTVSVAWLKKLSVYKDMAKLRTSYFDPKTGEMAETQMYVDGFRSSLLKDTSKKGLWNVSFTLKEF